MSPEESREFEMNPYHVAAVALREYDDRANSSASSRRRSPISAGIWRPRAVLSPEIKLVVFDWAGTTIDFGCMAPAGAFVATFAARGVPISLAEARGPMGMSKKDHIRAILRDAGVAERWRTATGHDWAEGDVEELYRDVTPRQVEAAGLYSTLIPGVIECVAHLRSCGIKIGGDDGLLPRGRGGRARSRTPPGLRSRLRDVPTRCLRAAQRRG